MDKKRLHLIIQGKVQGVFFRASTKEKARELGLRGFVRNRVDGTVEVVAEGHMAELQKLADWCHERQLTLGIGINADSVEESTSILHKELCEALPI